MVSLREKVTLNCAQTKRDLAKKKKGEVKMLELLTN